MIADSIPNRFWRDALKQWPDSADTYISDSVWRSLMAILGNILMPFCDSLAHTGVTLTAFRNL